MLTKAGFPPSTLGFFVLCGFDSTREQDWHRFHVLRSLGCEPFVMVYGPGSRELRRWARWVNRRMYRMCDWQDFIRPRHRTHARRCRFSPDQDDCATLALSHPRKAAGSDLPPTCQFRPPRPLELSLFQS